MQEQFQQFPFATPQIENTLRATLLQTHPEREQITYRYLKHRRDLVRTAIERLTAEEEREQDVAASATNVEEAVLEQSVSLHEQRLHAVIEVLQESGAKRVLDLGCGEGKLLKLLLHNASFAHILGLDVSYRALEKRASSSINVSNVNTTLSIKRFKALCWTMIDIRTRWCCLKG